MCSTNDYNKWPYNTFGLIAIKFEGRLKFSNAIFIYN